MYCPCITVQSIRFRETHRKSVESNVCDDVRYVTFYEAINDVIKPCKVEKLQVLHSLVLITMNFR